MTTATKSVLFLCTGNSVRSIMAEALLRHHAGDRFVACSAGSHPTWRVNSVAIELLMRHGMQTTGLRSKSWTEFEGEHAPPLDFVFTVCDSAAGETCPVWPGHPVTAHWGVQDPADVDGEELERLTAFRRAFRMLERRILLFTSLPLTSLDRLSLQTRLDEIGRVTDDT